MTSLRALYQDVIIDHGRHPRNFGVLTTATHHKEGHNPLCGDKITLYVQTDQDVIIDARFEGCGCAISMASTSLMLEAIKGKTIERVQKLFDDFHHLVTKTEHSSELEEHLGKLAVFHGVVEYPARVKCAILAWHTLHAALKADPNPVSTE